MKNINVCLRLMSHPLYRDLPKYPPHNVRYKIPKSTTTIKDNIVLTKLKKSFWIHYTTFKPPAVYVDTKNISLIHSNAGVMVLNKFPWVIDVEHEAAFANFHTDKLNSFRYRNQIITLLSSEYCKKIMPLSYVAKKSLERYFHNEKSIRNKLEVVYPAIKEFKVRKKKNKERIKLLFVGNQFFEKGGKQLLDTFELLIKKYDIELVVRSNPPSEIKKRYICNEIKFVQSIPSYEKLIRNFFMTSDIFVLPSFMDTFGRTFLESMACGLPIVTTDIFALPEIVENNKNGLLIHTPISMFANDYSLKYGPKSSNWKGFIRVAKSIDGKFVKDLTSKISFLIENDSIRRKMGKEGRKEVEKGKFSIKTRNEKLRKIYEEAIGDKS